MITFGRETTGNLAAAQSREWLVTNGIGGYASGTIAGMLTRRYHGLLVAALQPPLGRTLLLAKLDETAVYNNSSYPLFTNRWLDGQVNPPGYLQIEQFWLDGTIPTWHFACADALLVKRIWMEQGANTTYISYELARASRPLTLTLKALVNYRDYHSLTHGDGWQMHIEPMADGLQVHAFESAVPFTIRSDKATATPVHDWYHNFDLPVEQYRGLDHAEDHLHAGTFQAILEPGEMLTLVVSTEADCECDGRASLERRHHYERHLLDIAPAVSETTPAWIQQLTLAADQFVVDRPLANDPDGKTLIAGYHWFGDWGREAR